MTISISTNRAQLVVADAWNLSTSEEALPVEWTSHVRTIFSLRAKTFTPALATLLLAKAVDADVDTLSIKAGDANSYSLRSLGHGVIVPAASRYGFSLRTTGAEPLNNQPFFRYERIDEIDRVKHKDDFDIFLAVARRANLLSQDEALHAFAAFLRVAADETRRVQSMSIKTHGLSADGLRIAAADFLRAKAADRPRRLQAFAAACLDVGHQDVRARKLNDPSRDLPGDVHAFVAGSPILSVEVRGKPVASSEVTAFIEACARSGIERAILFVDATGHKSIDVEKIDSHTYHMNTVFLAVFESVNELLQGTLSWADATVPQVVATLASRMLDRLREIEVPRATLEEWERSIALLRGK